MIPSFTLGRLPSIEFGPGRLARLPELVSRYGTRLLLVTGAQSFIQSDAWHQLSSAFSQRDIEWRVVHVTGEPAPSLIDDTVSALRDTHIDCVVGIGGGSALDAAKAIAGLLKPGNSVCDHLEGVGPELPYHGPATPFIAVPTTAGTGSEATRNAVLSVQGSDGYKKSFRDDKLVAAYAVIDPDLLASCPKGVIAANGMDAFTQLLESYVSIRASPFTDVLALSGLGAMRNALLPWYEETGDQAEHRASMAYAALISGMTLAQVGLGSVHGLASPLGAFFPIPHGVVCGTLVAEATRTNLNALRLRAPDSATPRRYAQVGRLLSGLPLPDQEALAYLLDLLDEWTRRLNLPRLGAFGVTESDLPRIVANSRGSSMKTNPVALTDEEIAGIVRARL